MYNFSQFPRQKDNQTTRSIRAIRNEQSIIFDCTQKILRNNHNFQAYFNRGLAWIKLQVYQRAIDDFDRAIKINSNYPQLYYNRGLAYLAQEQYLPALSDFTTTIELESNYFSAYLKRGQTYALLKQYQAALDDFNKTLELNCFSPLAYYNRASTYYSLGDYKQALQDYQQLSKLETKDNLSKFYNLKLFSALSSKTNLHSTKSESNTNEIKSDTNQRSTSNNHSLQLDWLVNYNVTYCLAIPTIIIILILTDVFNLLPSRNKNPSYQFLTEQLPRKLITNSEQENNTQSLQKEQQIALNTKVTSVQDDSIPSGSFNYGGSIAWALIRAHIDPKILAKNPEFNLIYRQHSLLPPNSTTGIEMLLSEQLSIAQSSRPLHPAEHYKAQSQNFSLQQIPIARDAIVVAVHPKLKLEGLTLAQLKAIYTGKISNWQQLGGPDLVIVPISQSPALSGTAEFFKYKILHQQNLTSTVTLVDNVTQGIRKTAKSPGAIFYASAPEIIGQCTIKPIAIGLNQNNLIHPYRLPLISSEDCPRQRNQINPNLSIEYPLIYSLFIIVKQNGTIEEKAGLAYANLLLSPQGQKLLALAGYFSIKKNYSF